MICLHSVLQSKGSYGRKNMGMSGSPSNLDTKHPGEQGSNAC